MTDSSASGSRLALPLTEFGYALVEDEDAYESDEEIALTPEFEQLLTDGYVKRTRHVQLDGKSFNASVYEPSTGEGCRYVITDVNHVPVDMAGEESAQARDALAETPEECFDSYRHLLYRTVSRGESLGATGDLPLQSRFIPPTFTVAASRFPGFPGGQAEPGPDWSWEDLHRVSRAVILGAPGAGKTSALRRLALEHVSGRRGDKYLPIYIQLRNLTSVPVEEAHLPVAASQTLEAAAVPGLDEMARSGQALLLLDGLDEITPRLRRTVVRDLHGLCAEYPRLAVFVSCRSQSYAGEFRNFQHLSIQPLRQSEVHQWVWHEIGEAGSRDFMQNLSAEPKVNSLVRTPLLLAIAVDLFKSYGTLSRGRGFLYQTYLDALSDGWDRTRGIRRSDFTPPDPEKVMRTLCLTSYRMMSDNRSQFTLGDFSRWNVEDLHISEGEYLKFIQESTGLISRVGADEWTFVHRTFQEYLAAECLVRSTGDVSDLLARRASEPSWREVWQFVSERTVDASDLFGRMLIEKDGVPADVPVMLVAALLRDASVNPGVAGAVAEVAARFMLDVLRQSITSPDWCTYDPATRRLRLRLKAARQTPRLGLSRLHLLLEDLSQNWSDRLVPLIAAKLRQEGSQDTAALATVLARRIQYEGQMSASNDEEYLQADITVREPLAEGFGGAR
ncbi:NACHT domain-containing NTPase [Microbispora sp. H10836]|uniref:NACHT domain-containing protein n=1 Tax=Microbispora sp. H10836 TaxID=2729106 RepID=UPI001474E5BC|nr:NACHT domain-containing protein [Microbispora sp. H10836]